MLSERIQTQKATYYILLCSKDILEKAKLLGQKHISVSQRLGVGEGADYKKPRNLGGDETVLYLDCGGGYTSV